LAALPRIYVDNHCSPAFQLFRQLADDGPTPVESPMSSTFTDCSITSPYGAAEAYVWAVTDVNWKNSLGEMGVLQAVVDAITASDVAHVAILKDIEVYPANRGEGYGTELLSKVMAKFDEAAAGIVILYADMCEDNEFDLTEWYEGFGFKKIDNHTDAPCMVVASEELILQLRAANDFDADDLSPT
jgi:GNAT superfamily N-acetyltransferase